MCDANPDPYQTRLGIREGAMNAGNYSWAVQELHFRYFAGETMLNTIHIYIYIPIMTTLVELLNSNPDCFVFAG